MLQNCCQFIPSLCTLVKKVAYWRFSRLCMALEEPVSSKVHGVSHCCTFSSHESLAFRVRAFKFDVQIPISNLYIN